MLTKGFAKFVWEENVEKLKMPHFYLGKNILLVNICSLHTLKFVFLAFIFLGIGSALSIIVFFCEKLFVKKLKSLK